MEDIYLPQPDCTDLVCPTCKQMGKFTDIEKTELEGDVIYEFLCECGEWVEVMR